VDRARTILETLDLSLAVLRESLEEARACPVRILLLENRDFDIS